MFAILSLQWLLLDDPEWILPVFFVHSGLILSHSSLKFFFTSSLLEIQWFLISFPNLAQRFSVIRLVIEMEFELFLGIIVISVPCIFFLFCTMTNKCTIILQVMTLLHVSTLSFHPQGARSHYLAKLHKYVPGQHDSSIDIQTDCMRTVATKWF